MNTRCRIGKIKMRDGSVIHRLPDNNMTVYSSACDFECLNKANSLVRSGEAVSVAVVVVDKGDQTHIGFDKFDNVSSISVLGSIELLRDFVTKWAVGQ